MILTHAPARVQSVTPVNCRSKSENPRNDRAQSAAPPDFRFQLSTSSNFRIGLSWSTDYNLGQNPPYPNVEYSQYSHLIKESKNCFPFLVCFPVTVIKKKKHHQKQMGEKGALTVMLMGQSDGAILQSSFPIPRRL